MIFDPCLKCLQYALSVAIKIAVQSTTEQANLTAGYVGSHKDGKHTVLGSIGLAVDSMSMSPGGLLACTPMQESLIHRGKENHTAGGVDARVMGLYLSYVRPDGATTG